MGEAPIVEESKKVLGFDMWRAVVVNKQGEPIHTTAWWWSRAKAHTVATEWYYRTQRKANDE